MARNSPFIHRDLSWLQFNERVLSEARLAANPLLERAKFLAITASNLDEFFMIRISSLNRSIQLAKRNDRQKEIHRTRIRDNLLEAVIRFSRKQDESLDLLTNALHPAKIVIVRKAKPDQPAFEIGKKVFTEQILPNLTSPEPFSLQQLGSLDNLQMGALHELNLWFKIPKSLPYMFVVKSEEKSDSTYAFFLDDLVMSHLPTSFGLSSDVSLFRLTRDGDLQVDLEKEDTESIPDAVQTGLRVRDKGKPVRLQCRGSITPHFLTKIIHFLKCPPHQVQMAPSSLCLQGLWLLVNQAPESADPTINLRHPTFKAFVPKCFKEGSKIFDRLKERDYLLHHPYDSFDAFVNWIKTACADPKVEMIEQTVYRIDALSPIMGALKSAAKHKKIRVMIELRARFDELNNLRLADELQKAGVEVGFGFGKLKLHAKVALVTRQEENGLAHYTHLSTGNYNATTAQTYTDLALLTSHPDFGSDARHFFDTVWNGKVPTQFKQLVSAPLKLHKKLLNLIEGETEAAKAGRPARIVAKVNALVDETVILKLYEASTAGVYIDLIVRGACSLIPGVKGLSENIRVISIIDRYLEHSRIYYFGDSKALYLSSADWMPRNFFSRLELAFPILDSRIHRFLEEVVIPTYLLDSVKARDLTSSGVWKRRSVKLPEGSAIPSLIEKRSVRAQSLFEELAETGYEGALLSRGVT
ncbi:MAG: Polyphosphate kinase [Bacteriovoracaceae bacterium]|nr:Polyphosphate kinase [Bacteriovoracaceae bacterium]